MVPLRWLLFAHVLGALLWVGGGTMLAVVGMRVRATHDARAIGDFARTLSYVGLRVFLPSVVVVLVSGGWMVASSAAFDFGQRWIQLAIGAFLAAFLVGAGYLGRVGIRLERLTSAETVDLDEARALLGQWLAGYGLVLVLLAFAVWDMIFKPGF